MPKRPPTPCKHPGCPRVSDTPFCIEHGGKVDKIYDRSRGTSSQRGYNSQWRKIRQRVLTDEPLCRRCQDVGRVVVATLVHHRDRDTANNSRANLEPLCAACHEVEHADERRG